MKPQDDIFKSKEADNFYKRRIESNVTDKGRLMNDQPLVLIERNNLKPKKAAEIGACNGFRLAALHDVYKTECIGFEPSVKAIEDGRKKYPRIKFHRNTAAKLDAADEYFDLVIIYNVFHWIDRRKLFASVAEADRILKNGGYLILGDFWVPFPQKRRYHHLPKQMLWTYKQNYWEIFLASRCYELIDFITPSFKDKQIQPKRVITFCALLRKNLDGTYPIIE